MGTAISNGDCRSTTILIAILFEASRDVVVSLEQTIYYRDDAFRSKARLLLGRLRLDTLRSRWI